jgi:NADPH:quinone reductase-like Zn-dependent oxidoreductase
VGLGLLAPEYANFGVEFAGVVGKVGAQVNDLKVGDRVVSLRDKCFANKVRLPALACAKIPKKLSFSEAGSILGAYATVIHSLVDVGRVSEGQVTQV